MESVAYRDLQLLSEVEDSPEITQRELSRRLGIALGLTNVLLRNLIKRGYIRANQASWKRWLYALTPDGFSHKIRLTVAYIHRFLDHYQNVRQTLRLQLEPLALHEESRVAIYGTGEFAELVYLGLKDVGIEEMDIFGPNGTAGHRFLGMLVRDVTELNLEQYDRVFLASLNGSPALLAELLVQREAAEKLITFFSDGHTKEGV